MKNNEKFKKISIVVIALAIVVIGTTFAYFVAQISGGATGNVNVTANKTDDFTFEVTKDISLTMNQFNFASGSGNLSDSAVARAKLLANNSTNSATYNYYVYFNIDSNNYVYTTGDSKPEIVLSITDPTGAEVTSIDGLNYVTSTNADGTTVDGFDVTTKSGLFTVASNYEIVSNSSTNATVQDWTFTVTLINLDSDQHLNEGKSFSGTIMIQKEKIEQALAVYWNDGFGGNSYAFPNTPATTYTSPTQISVIDSKPYYIKTTATEHQACLYYNSKEFCLKANYWDTDGSTTQTKLQNEMASALGVDTSELSCASNSSYAYCDVSAFRCNAHSGGFVYCGGGSGDCGVDSVGIAYCG